MANEDVLASIIVNITADADEFIETIGEASDEAKSFAEVGAALAGAGSAVVGTLVAMSESAAEFGGKIFDMEQRTGLAADTLSGLTLATQVYGRNIEAVSTTVRKLATEVEEATQFGWKEAIDAFDELNVSLYDTDGSVKSLDELLPEVVDALSKVKDTTLQVSETTLLFGRSGLALLPIFKQGSQGLTDWANIAKETGASVTESQATVSKEFQVAQATVVAAIKGLSISVGQELMPMLMRLADAARDDIVAFDDWVRGNGPLVQSLLEVGVSIVGVGGLMAGLGAAVALWPLLTKVVAESVTPLVEMATAVRSAAEALSILKGVNTLADLSAGLKLISESSTLASAGLVGLAAAVGIGIGALADWGIKQAGLQDRLDSWTKSLQAHISYEGAMLDTAQAAADVLKNKYGVTIEYTGGSIDAFNQKVQDTLKAYEANDPELQKQIAANKELNQVVEALKIITAGYSDELGTQTKAQLDLNDAVAKGETQSRTYAEQGANLSAVINKLTDDGVSLNQITAEYGRQAVTVNDLIKRGAVEVSAADAATIALVASREKDYEASQKLSTATQSMVDSLESESIKFKALRAAIDQAVAAHVPMKTIVDQLGKDVEALVVQLQSEGGAISANVQSVYDAARAHDQLATAYSLEDPMLQGVNEGLREQIYLLQTLHDRAAQGNADAATSAADNVILQTTIDESTKSTGLFTAAGRQASKALVDLDEKMMTSSINASEFHKALKDAGPTAAQEFADAWDSAITRMTNRLANDLAKDIVNFKSFGDTMKSVAKDFAQGMLDALIKGLLQPMENALTGFASSLVGGGNNGGFGGGGGGGILGTIASFLGGGGGGGILSFLPGIGAIAGAGITAYELVKNSGSNSIAPVYDAGNLSVGYNSAPLQYTYTPSYINPTTGQYSGYQPGGQYYTPPTSSPSTPSQQINITFPGNVIGLPNDVVQTITDKVYEAVRFGGLQVQGAQ